MSEVPLYRRQYSRVARNAGMGLDWAGGERERARESERERERGEIETTGYEPFDLDAPIHWAMSGYVIEWQGGTGRRNGVDAEIRASALRCRANSVQIRQSSPDSGLA